jgi:hypothetical protein
MGRDEADEEVEDLEAECESVGQNDSTVQYLEQISGNAGLNQDKTHKRPTKPVEGQRDNALERLTRQQGS